MWEQVIGERVSVDQGMERKREEAEDMKQGVIALIEVDEKALHDLNQVINRAKHDQIHLVERYAQIAAVDKLFGAAARRAEQAI